MEKRIFGATDGIREKVGVWPLRPNAMRKLGASVAKYLKKQPTLMIGRDTRISGTWMADEFVVGAKAEGAQIVDCGILPTPALSILIKHNEAADGGAMMTASHNPATDNGVKVFRADGDKLSDEEELAVEDLYFEGEVDDDIEPKNAAELNLEPNQDALEAYIKAAREVLGDIQLDGEIVYDAASGAGQHFDKAVMEAFGLKVDVISPEPDGENINDGCGALYPENVAKIAKERGLPGVAMDGDADRVMIVDEEGRIWDGDREVSVLSQYLKEKGELAGDTVVLTEYSNLGAIKYLNAQGIKVEKVVNGDRFVAQKCMENGYVIGSEFSGHIMYLPWLNSSDAVFVTLMLQKIAHEKKCRLADLWPDYEMMPSKQWGLMVREKRPLEEVPGWNEALAEAEETLDGRGRVFCRYSGTENKLRILVEAESMELVETAGEALAKLIKKEIGA